MPSTSDDSTSDDELLNPALPGTFKTRLSTDHRANAAAKTPTDWASAATNRPMPAPPEISAAKAQSWEKLSVAIAKASTKASDKAVAKELANDWPTLSRPLPAPQEISAAKAQSWEKLFVAIAKASTKASDKAMAKELANDWPTLSRPSASGVLRELTSGEPMVVVIANAQGSPGWTARTIGDAELISLCRVDQQRYGSNRVIATQHPIDHLDIARIFLQDN